MAEYILAVHCGHDASVVLLRDGRLASAIAQERLDRIKHSNATGRPLDGDVEDDVGGFPADAVHYCLEAEGIDEHQVGVFTTNYWDDPPAIGRQRVPFPSHHHCHAASAFHTWNSKRCAILVMDYAGDSIWLEEGPSGGTGFLGYERETAWLGDAGGLSSVWEHLGSGPILFGLGSVYNQVAAYLFPRSGDSEGKLMALAPYGSPNRELGGPFFTLVRGRAYVRPSLLFRESTDRPSFLASDVPHYGCELDWDALPPSPAQTGKVSQFHRDLAFRVQRDLEDALVYMASHLRRVTAAPDLALAGGVALNCTATARVARESGFNRVHIPPAAGDAGQSLGAALLVARDFELGTDSHEVVFGGREYSDAEIEAALRAADATLCVDRPSAIESEVAQLLAAGRIIGWFQGGSEFGPRALGARSIVADPRSPAVVKRLNEVVKRRQWFQPVAPSVLAEEWENYFEGVASPFMTFASTAKELAQQATPGIVHADRTSRVQTVRQDTDPIYYRLISEFKARTGIPLIANTSFNDRGEPIVETPEDAIAAFMRMPLDALAIGPFLATRSAQ